MKKNNFSVLVSLFFVLLSSCDNNEDFTTDGSNPIKSSGVPGSIVSRWESKLSTLSEHSVILEAAFQNIESETGVLKRSDLSSNLSELETKVTVFMTDYVESNHSGRDKPQYMAGVNEIPHLIDYVFVNGGSVDINESNGWKMPTSVFMFIKFLTGTNTSNFSSPDDIYVPVRNALTLIQTMYPGTTEFEEEFIASLAAIYCDSFTYWCVSAPKWAGIESDDVDVTELDAEFWAKLKRLGETIAVADIQGAASTYVAAGITAAGSGGTLALPAAGAVVTCAAASSIVGGIWEAIGNRNYYFD